MTTLPTLCNYGKTRLHLIHESLITLLTRYVGIFLFNFRFSYLMRKTPFTFTLLDKENSNNNHHNYQRICFT